MSGRGVCGGRWRREKTVLGMDFFFEGTGANYNSRNRKKKPADKGPKKKKRTKDKRERTELRLVLQPAHTAVGSTQRPKAYRLTQHPPTPPHQEGGEDVKEKRS